MTRRDLLRSVGPAAVGTVLPQGTLAQAGGVRASSAVARAKEEVAIQLAYQLLGCSVFCSSRDPEVVTMGTRLFAPERKGPVPANALFDMMSVTKTFTAHAGAQLVAEGKLDPDAPFTKYLPEHVLAKGKCPITVRDLATHISGFGNGKITRDYEACVWSKRPSLGHREKFLYSCYNYILLGRIVERVAGKRLDEVCRERIWRPLGMTDTRWWPVKDPDLGRTVQIIRTPKFLGWCQDGQCQVYGKPQGNAGIFSTAGDMLKYAEDLRQRKAFPAAVYRLLFTPTYEGATGRRSWGWDMGAHQRPAGWSASTIVHSGFSGQTVAVDPEGDFAGVVLTSRTAEHETGRLCRARVLSILKTGTV